jgi:predicted Zn-dependent protease
MRARAAVIIADVENSRHTPRAQALGRAGIGHGASARDGVRAMSAALLAACLLLPWSWVGAASPAGTEPLRQAIRAQPLADALTAFALETGLQVIYESRIVDHIRSGGADAGLQPKAALEALLMGSGISFEFINDRTVRLLVPAASQGAARPPSPAADSPPRDGGAGDLPRVVVTQRRRALRPAVAPASSKEQRVLESAARELEQRLEQGHRLYGRAPLDQYLQELADRLLAVDPEPRPSTVRVRVIKDAAANAFALPNGSVFVTTDLLVRLESEAEIACVLGHEITHFVNLHALQQLRTERRAFNVSEGMGGVLAVILGISASRSGIAASSLQSVMKLPQDVFDIWAAAAVSGYSRDLEREADYEGLRRAAAAGYDSSAGTAAFEHLAQAAPPAETTPPAHFASHPKLVERIASYKALIASELADSVGPPNVIGQEGYRAAIHGVELDQAEILLASGAPDRARALVDSAVARDDTARGEFLAGEIARQTAPQTPELQEQALSAYARAIALPNTPPAAFRQQGILLRRRGDRSGAAAAFRAYLERAPGAVDVALVKLYLDALAAPNAPSAEP